MNADVGCTKSFITMANKTILMIRIRQILRLYTEGTSKKKISELSRSSRNTVKKYIHKFIQEHLTYEDIQQMSDHELELLFGQTEPLTKDERFDELQRLLPEMEKQMKRKGMTLLLLFEQYRKEHSRGYGITQFYHYYRLFAKRSQPVMHIEHKAGDKLYVDFAGDKLTIVDDQSGEVGEVEVFVAILGCSQLTYVEAVATQKKEDFIKACEQALFYFGGVPAAIVPDNLKSAVTKSSRYEPAINDSFADFAEHYTTAILPARVYRPKDKALVEGMVKIVYRAIYTQVNQKIYTSLSALNKAIHEALEVLNNAPFKGREYSRRQQFEEVERSALRPLPIYRYEFKQQVMVTVMKHGYACLAVDKHYYSVPYRYIGKKVKILYTSALVEIFYRYERIASHKRNYDKYQYSKIQEHLPLAHRYLEDWSPEKLIEKASAIHEQVATYIIAIFERKQHPEQAYKSCSGILNLLGKVGKERLSNACKRAHSYGVYTYSIIQQILERNLDYLSEEEQEASFIMPEHHNIRGSHYYE
jgi:transposase